MRDIMCSGYVAGANTGFFGAKGEEAVASSLKGPVSSDAVKLDISSRLSFDDEERGEYQSMLAFACGYGDGAKRDQVISITDRLLPWEVHGSDTAKTYFPGGPENYQAYRNAWELHTIHFGEDVRAAENMEFISQGSSNNGLCFIGPHRKYNPYSNLYHELIPGQGHFGPVSNAHRTVTLTRKTKIHKLTCSARAHLAGCDPRRRTLASWRGGIPQGVPGFHGVARGCGALADVP